MNKLALVFIGVFLSTYIYSQTVENIRTQQDGGNINIFYQLPNSNTNQVFNISLFVSIEGKEKIKLNAVTGDVGENIPGGKSEYRAIWDVLKDVDELSTAEFFVEAKEKDNGATINIKPTINNEHKFFVAFNSSTVLPFGFRVGILSNWGGYAALRLGTVYSNYSSTYSKQYQDEIDNQYDMWSDNDSYTENTEDSETGFSFNAGVSKRIINNTDFQFHLYSGMGFGYWSAYQLTDDYYDGYAYWVEDYTQDYSWAREEFSHYDGNGDPVYNYYYGYYERENTVENNELIEIDIDFEFGAYFTYKRVLFNIGFDYGLFNDAADVVFGVGYKF